MKRLALIIPLLAAVVACHHEPEGSKPVGLDRKLEAPPPAPDVAPSGPAPGMPGAALTVAAARPQGELEGLARPTITFNKPVAAMATLEQGDKLDPARGITIEPKLPGAWHWLGSSSVEFVNDAQLPYSTEFKVTVPAGLAALDGSKLAEGYSFSFTTVRLKVQSIDTVPESDLCRWSTPQQSFELRVNQPLAEPARGVFFEIEGGGRIDAKLLQSANLEDEQRAKELAETDPAKKRHVERASTDALKFKSQVTRYQFQPVSPLPANKSFGVSLDVMAKAAQGPLTAPEPWRQACSTYGPMVATSIARCYESSAHCATGPISISFTNPLGKISEVRSRLHIEPAVTLDWDEQDPELGVELGDHRTTLRIPAHWKPGQAYKISLDAGVTDRFGQAAAAFSGSVALDDLTPSMFIGRDIGLLEAAGDGQLPAQTTNVKELDADLWQLTPAEWLKLRNCSQASCYPARPPDASPRTALTDPKNESQLHGIDLRQAFKDGKKTGLVLAKIWAPGTDSAENPSKAMIQITDVIAHAKIGLTSGVVWVTSAQTGQPRPGAQVSVIGPAGTEVAHAVADQDGLATLPPLAKMETRKPDRAWETPVLLVAATDQDDTGVVTTNWEDVDHDGVEGASFDGLSARALGTVFTDRGIYRPGDTVHVKGLLRKAAFDQPTNLSTPAGMKVSVTVKDPDDKDIFTKEVTLSRYGTYSIDAIVPKDGRLGGYNITTAQPGAASQGTWSGFFTVAEYRAPTFRVDLLAGKSELLAGDSLTTTVSARYLFGGAMKGAKATWSVTRNTAAFSPPRNEGFSFGRQTWGYDENEPAPDSGLFASGNGIIDGQGNLTIEAGKADAPGDRPANYTVEAEVQDVSRQTVAGHASVLLHPASFYVGIGSRSIFATAGQPIKLDIVAAKPDGSRISGTAVKLTALNRAWHSVRKKGVNGTYETVSEVVDEAAGSCDVKTSSDAASCELNLTKPGFYTIRAEAKDEQGRLALSSVGIYALGPGFASWSRGDSPKVELVADKAQYAVGETAHVLIKSPYPECNALISTEREGIIDRRMQKLIGTATSIDVPITEAMVPNVFVGVVLQRARVEKGGLEPGDDPGRPSVKAGTVRLSVGRQVKRLAVEVKVPKEEWRPRQTVPIDVAVKDSAGQPRKTEVTVFAVDEGVLRLTDYQVPELLSDMFPDHSLGVALGEPMLSLVRRQKFGEKGEVQPGGGGGKGNGNARNKFVTTALWTTVETDAQGHARANLELPDNLTTFRIMAVALTDSDRFGTGQTAVRVSLPLLVLPALPRFARTGDEFEAGVVVNAKGLGSPQSEVKVSAELSGAVALASGQPAEQTVTVEEGVAREVRFKLVATANGTAKMIFRASAAGATGAGGPFSDGVEQSIPVQLPTDLEAVAVYGETAEKSTEGLLPPDGVRAGVGGLKLTLSSTALGGLSDNMEQLVQYPYGCLEQLSSRLVPFVAIREVSRVFGVEAGPNAPSSQAADSMNRMLSAMTERTDGATPATPDEVVAETVKKIENLQTPSGGFRYWPSSTCASAWPSIYATLSLHRAKEMGYPVDAGVLSRAKRFVGQKAAGTGECPYEIVGLETRAFALQVLARMGAPLPAYYDELYAQKDKLPLFGKALLADAILVGKGKRPRAEALMQDLFDHAQESQGELHFAENNSETYAPLFSSDARTTGMALQTLVDMQPGHPFISKITRYFAAVRRKTGSFRNTQEAAYALMGLTEVVRARERTAPDFTAKVSLGGKELASQVFKGRSLDVVTKTVPIDEVIAAAKHGGKGGAPFLFTVDGAGLLQYGALFQYAPEKMPMTPRDEGIFVQRWLEPYDSDGKAATEFQAGELVRVRVRVATRMERHYVAVDVPLPAGLEAVDLQLATTARLPTAHHQEAKEGEGEEGYDDNSAQGDSGDAESDYGYFYSPFIWSEKRDDRAIYFADLLPPGVHLQSFVARATTPGKFLLKPAKAEEMYSPEVFGRSEGSMITVVAQKPLASK
jgi:uncharacterized protein YfaS (alpha-2-macroglobulin family)